MEKSKVALGLLVAAVLVPTALGYCNSMSGMGYGPRTSKAFPPGWNGLARTPFRGWYVSILSLHSLSSQTRTLCRGWCVVRGVCVTIAIFLWRISTSPHVPTAHDRDKTSLIITSHNGTLLFARAKIRR